MQITVRGELFPSDEQAREIDELMRVQSSCMRYSYNRLCEGKSKPEIERELMEKFPELNSRYRRAVTFGPNTTISPLRNSKKLES